MSSFRDLLSFSTISNRRVGIFVFSAPGEELSLVFSRCLSESSTVILKVQPLGSRSCS